MSIDFARNLRRNLTDAERRLWYALRAGRFGDCKFRRQAPIGQYIVDFVCPEHSLIIEIDGGQHAEPKHREHDPVRTTWLESQGYRVLRFWNRDVLEDRDAVLEGILKTLGPSSPLPNPPPPGGWGPESASGA